MDWLAHGVHEVEARRIFFRRAFHMLKFNGVSGAYVEFGCASARTFRLAWSESRGHDNHCEMWAFDSFAGLPASGSPHDAHPRWIEGSMRETKENFSSLLRLDGVDLSEVNIVEGFYAETLSLTQSSSLPTDISLAWIDCDLYSSSNSVFRFLETRLKHGMILAIDDYFCYSSTDISGERRAFLELVSRTQDYAFCPYMKFGWHGASFIVEKSEYLPGNLSGVLSC